MERVTGIGGVFFRAGDPVALARWYRHSLGVEAYSEADDVVWWPAPGPTVFAPFPRDTDYFGGDQAWMVNFRVPDLDAMREQLRGLGATVLEGTEVLEGIGRFGWFVDPEGNRVELWEPAPEALREPGGAR